MDARLGGGREGVVAHGAETLLTVPWVHLRLIAVFALAGALLGAAGSLAREPVYSARSYVVKVPPARGTKAGLELTPIATACSLGP